MPIFTNTYKLGAFQQGEVYDPSIDQSRMKRIDQNMEFLSDLIGDGKISGWSIRNESTTSEFDFSLTTGYGIIDKFSVYSWGDIDFSLNDNTVNYIFLQKKNGVVGGFSGLSNYDSIAYTDSLTTSDVTGFSISSYDYNFVALTWDANPEPDIDYYLIERSPDNIVWTEIAQATGVAYTDSDVEDNTTYYYRIKAVDINGNASASYSVPTPAFVLTLKDLSAPANPAYVLTFPQDGQVELVWDAPSSGSVASYQIDYVRVDSEYNEIGSTSSETTTETSIIIDELNNEFTYSFTVYSVSEFSVQSEGITVFATPKSQAGPSEVDLLTISNIASASNDTGIALSISWEDLADPYFANSESYEITIIENGSTISNTISSTSTSKVIEVYVDTNGTSRNIKPRTDYVVLVKGIDSNGVKNNGVVGNITTGNFKDPASPSNLSSIEAKNGDLFFAWKNSTSVFLYNEITLTSNDGTTITTIENATNYGRANSYTIDFDQTSLSTTYTMKVTAVDEFGNKSPVSEVSITTISSSDIPSNPEPPGILEVFSNDKVIILVFEPFNGEDNIYAESYKIWRGPYKQGLIPTDFTLVDTIPATSRYFEDFSAVNNTGYFYFVTTVDRFGNESLNPVDDLFISYPMSRGYAHPNISFEAHGDITATASGYDAIISWDPSSDSFDGYEILRSKGDVFNFEVVGSVTKEIGYFTDENALLEDGVTYYYAIRKYRNEIKVVDSLTNTAPDSSLLLATITISNGDVSIVENAEDISNIQIAAIDSVSDRIDSHTHSITLNYDRRVDLAKNAIIEDWTTSNNLVFSTTQDISAATSFVVKVDGELPSIFYSVNPSNNTITFSSQVTGSVSLEAVGLNETKNIIQKERVENVFAAQIESGTVLRNQFDTYNHEGRQEEDVLPLQFKMKTDDGFKYSILQNEYTTTQELVSQGITFYDIIGIGDITFLSWALFEYEEWEYFSYEDWFFFNFVDVAPLVAGTSQGLYVSFDRGANWEQLRATTFLVQNIFNAAINGAYFALSGSDVYYSKNGLGWVKMNGLENVSFCKDITEDDFGNVYVSTNLGVYKLDQTDLGDQLVWQHAAFSNAESSDCYGIWYDDINGELLLSNEVGLFSSTDRGATWNVSTVISEPGPVYDFHEEVLEYSTYVYATQNGTLWRKNSLSGTFEVIATLEHDLRKVDIYLDRIVLTSSDGFLISDSTYDPYSDTDIQFVRLKSMDVNENRVDATMARQVRDRLYFGTDGKLAWTNDLERFVTSYSDYTVPYSSVFIDENRQQIGVYYGATEVFFDNPKAYGTDVFVANQYVGYYSVDSGWVDQNYDAEIRLFENNALVAELESDSFSLPISQLNSVTFETFTDSTYNVALATLFKTEFESERIRLITVAAGDTSALNEGESIQSVLNSTLKNFYKVYANKFGDIRFKSTITIDGNEYSVINNELVLTSVLSQMYPEYAFVDFIDPAIVQYQEVVQVDPVNGVLGFLSEKNKYDYLKINIENAYLFNTGENTHEELDDAFDLVNTGLPTVVSALSHINLVKQGIFIEKTFGKTHTTPIDECEFAVPIQADYIISDSQNWYDTLNSTIDYEEQVSADTINTSISYPIDVEYISSAGEIWVGGLEGLVAIDINNENVSLVDFNNGKQPEAVYDIFQTDGDIYIVTAQNLYLTSDNGDTWSSVFAGGARGFFRKLSKVKSNLVLFTTTGVYYKNNAFKEWQASTSNVTSPNLVDNSDLLFAFDGNQLYTSTNGIAWNTRTDFGTLDVNGIVKYRGIFLVATGEGLRSDGATFYGNTSALSIIDVAGNVTLSDSYYMNDVDADSDNQVILAGQNNGDYWIFSSGSWAQNTDSYLDTIHKVLLINQQPWLFGNDMFKSPNRSVPLRLAESSPL